MASATHSLLGVLYKVNKNALGGHGCHCAGMSSLNLSTDLKFIRHILTKVVRRVMILILIGQNEAVFT
jgi:hypothetical protein